MERLTQEIDRKIIKDNVSAIWPTIPHPHFFNPYGIKHSFEITQSQLLTLLQNTVVNCVTKVYM